MNSIFKPGQRSAVTYLCAEIKQEDDVINSYILMQEQEEYLAK